METYPLTHSIAFITSLFINTVYHVLISFLHFFVVLCYSVLSWGLLKPGFYTKGNVCSNCKSGIWSFFFRLMWLRFWFTIWKWTFDFEFPLVPFFFLLNQFSFSIFYFAELCLWFLFNLALPFLVLLNCGSCLTLLQIFPLNLICHIYIQLV